MAGHTHDTFGRQKHGYCANPIPFEVASIAEAMVTLPDHFMNSQRRSCLVILMPADKLGFWISYRLNSSKMAGAAANPGVGVARYLFVMGEVAPPTITQGLNGVVEFCGAGVTLRTGEVGMRNRPVRVDVDQGNQLSGQLLGLVPRQPVAVKAEPFYLLLTLWTSWIDTAMTGHAAFVLRRKGWQSRALFVTGPALFVLGS